jgi:hypothetical protein
VVAVVGSDALRAAAAELAPAVLEPMAMPAALAMAQDLDCQDHNHQTQVLGLMMGWVMGWAIGRKVTQWVTHQWWKMRHCLGWAIGRKVTQWVTHQWSTLP